MARKKIPARVAQKKAAKSSRDTKSAGALENREKSFPVVGIGASAGGLSAFEQFFSKMPADSGMAFILIPHLDPGHEISPSTVKRHTENILSKLCLRNRVQAAVYAIRTVYGFSTARPPKR